MKSTFSRQVSTTVLILLLALLLLGGAFRVLVGQYLEHNTHNQLRTDALSLAELVAAYDAAGDLEHENLRTNLTLASLVSGADTVVLDALGNVILCSDADLQCPHLGLTINRDFLDDMLPWSDRYREYESSQKAGALRRYGDMFAKPEPPRTPRKRELQLIS